MITVYQVLRQGVGVDAIQFFTLATTGNTRRHKWKLLKPRTVSQCSIITFQLDVKMKIL